MLLNSIAKNLSLIQKHKPINNVRFYYRYDSSMFANYEKILIANRGEIACRIMRTCKRVGIKTVAIYSDADINAQHVKMADEAYNVGPPPTGKSYLNISNIVEAAKNAKVDAVHPGYGFLSENSKFVHALNEAGIVFIGPSEKSMEVMGDKITSKRVAKEAGVSTVPGFDGPARDLEHALEIASDIGFPVMLKASHGGGGKGMRICWDEKEVKENYKLAKSEAMSSFGNDELLVEKFIDQPRHIEIQLIGDQHGNVFYLPERECSIQRRNQKVIEEAPSVHLDQKTREEMGKQAVQLAKRVGYFSAGTVEFLVDQQRKFYYLEMNTRLQVEHPITEMITELDLVECMLRVAAKQKLPFKQEEIRMKGWAIESRVYAEDPKKYLPSIGTLTTYMEPKTSETVRCDSGVKEGSEISVYYDPMICKLCTYGNDRNEALKRMEVALDQYVIKGLTHNIPLLREVISHPRFVEGRLSTKFLKEEFPNGFEGHELKKDEEKRLLTLAAWIYCNKDVRNKSWVGRNFHEQISLPEEWKLHIKIKGQTAESKTISEPVKVDLVENGRLQAVFEDGSNMTVAGDWKIDSPLVRGSVEGKEIFVQYLEKLALGFRLSFLGSKYDVQTLTEKQYELLKYMKEKPKADLSNSVLSPMPGVVVSLSVKEGDIITEGAEICIVEAMKMQNVLRSHQPGRIKSIRVKESQNVQANEILVEIEDVQTKQTPNKP